MPSRAVRKSDAQNGGFFGPHGDKALRADVKKAVERRSGGCSPGEQALRGHTCRRRGDGQNRRQSRSAEPGMRTERSEAALAALPSAMAQEQEVGTPFGFNVSDYEEEYSIPDFPDATPFVPVNPRTRRKQVASLGVTTFTLCALCIDRVRAATNVQVYYEMIENWASAAAKLAVIWVGALLLALPELLLCQLVSEDGDSPDVTPCERCVVRIPTGLPDTLYVLGLTYDSARLFWTFCIL